MRCMHEAVELDITHIGTSDYYGPYVTNEILTSVGRVGSSSSPLL
jgi:aryl-alcohol dehydrogenase-like predicted oxidoreductase